MSRVRTRKHTRSCWYYYTTHTHTHTHENARLVASERQIRALYLFASIQLRMATSFAVSSSSGTSALLPLSNLR